MSYKNYLQAALALSFIWIFKRLGLSSAQNSPGCCAFFGRFTREHKLADVNMAAALPELTPQERKIALRDMWHNIGHVLAEMAHMKHIARKPNSVCMCMARAFARLKESGKPFVLVSAHTGNWEINMVLLEQMGFEAGAIYRASNNPVMDKWIVNQRAGYHATSNSKGAEGSKQMIRLRKTVCRWARSFDQRLNTGDPITFFGRPTRAPSAAVKLAHRFDLMVLPVRVCRAPTCPTRPISMCMSKPLQGQAKRRPPRRY